MRTTERELERLQKRVHQLMREAENEVIQEFDNKIMQREISRSHPARLLTDGSHDCLSRMS